MVRRIMGATNGMQDITPGPHGIRLAREMVLRTATGHLSRTQYLVPSEGAQLSPPPPPCNSVVL